MTENAGKIKIVVDRELEELIPGFLSNRAADIMAIIRAVEERDFEKAKIIGHTLKGIGSGYGFEQITIAGAALEQAAKAEDISRLVELAQELQAFLANVEVVYQ